MGTPKTPTVQAVLGMAGLTLIAAFALFMLWPTAAGGQDDQHAVQVVEVGDDTISISWEGDSAYGYAVAWWPLDYSLFRSAWVTESEYTIRGLRSSTTYHVDVSGVGTREVTTLAAGQQPGQQPEITITGSGGITEGGGAVFTLAADPAPSADLTVSVNVTQQGDFGVTTGTRTATIPTGGSATLTVSTTDDGVDEVDGSVTATLTTGSGYTVSPTQGAAAIAVSDDDDPQPSGPEVSIVGGSGVTEGGDAVFALIAVPSPASPLSVSVDVTQQGDFGVNTGTQSVTIPIDGTTTLTMSTTDDGVYEAAGSVTATLQTGHGYTISGTLGAATVSVVDADAVSTKYSAPLALVADVRSYAAETHRGMKHVERWKRVLIGLGVNTYSGLTAMTAAEAQKYSDRGWTRWDPVVTELEKAEAAQAQQQQAGPEVSIVGGSGVTEGVDVTFTVSANPAPSDSLSVSVDVTQDGDYGVTTGTYTVSIPTGGSATLTVATTDDSVEETDGSITATLVDGADYTISAAQSSATVAVADDDSSSLNDDSQSGGTLGDAFVESLEDAMQRTQSKQQGSQSDPALQVEEVSATQQRSRSELSVQQQQQMTTSIVYVVDDSGSMDGDWPEVRTALEQVRDMSGVTDTKVALISFGLLYPTILFPLTDHASAPWDTPISGHTGVQAYLNGRTRIEAFGGFKGGTAYRDPLLNAKALLDVDTAATKKIVFMSDAEAAGDGHYPTDAMTEIINDGIIVDTIFFGDHYSDRNSDLQKMSTDTGGSHTDVPKPSTGTTNTPAVTARALSDILSEKAAADTTTLYLVDSTFSLMPRTEDGAVMSAAILTALEAVETKVQGIATARAGIARFLGQNEIADVTYTVVINGVETTRTYEVDDRFQEAYALEVAFNTGSAFDVDRDDFFMAQTGSSELDHALDQAHAGISAESGTTKRVVLITDGITPDKPTAATLQKYVDDGILLDVVALGSHADRVYLKSIADTNSNWTFNVAQ